ncbi:MAG: hydrogenase formation protein HypD [Negativicutes bacterium]|nr:hydrogenase formation protein HypD [Negativicutes bacterium]
MINQIKRNIEKLGRRITVMEVCGTHTTAIHRNGFPSLLQDEINFLSGPGCPVCVTSSSFIDKLANIAQTAAVYSFGDMLRVPGNKVSLAQARAKGADIRIMVSPLAAAQQAAASGEPTVIAAIGFDTTAPAFALAVEFCVQANIKNVHFLTELKTIASPLRYLLSADPQFDGLLLPGHVAAVIGVQGFHFLSEYTIPSVVTGFEGRDILEGLSMLTDAIRVHATAVHNQYRRIVKAEGNKKAQAIIERYYQPCDAYFRGIGMLPDAGLRLRDEFAAWEYPLSDYTETEEQNTACRCGEVLLGRIKPYECPLFGMACRPDHPCGACMVSNEGSCAAYFRYGRETYL